MGWFNHQLAFQGGFSGGKKCPQDVWPRFLQWCPLWAPHLLLCKVPWRLAMEKGRGVLLAEILEHLRLVVEIPVFCRGFGTFFLLATITWWPVWGMLTGKCFRWGCRQGRTNQMPGVCWWYYWWFRNPARKPVEVLIVYPFIHKVWAPSKRWLFGISAINSSWLASGAKLVQTDFGYWLSKIYRNALVILFKEATIQSNNTIERHTNTQWIKPL